MKITDIEIGAEVAALIKHRFITGRQVCKVMSADDPRHMSLFHRASNQMPLYTEEEVERFISSEEFNELSGIIARIHQITEKIAAK